MNAFNAGDRFWERLKVRFPALRRIDPDMDWVTWLQHAAITVGGGLLLGWAVPLVSLHWGMRIFVAAYFVREVVNVSDRRRIRLPLKPLDHVMDVCAPLVACELVGWWL